VNYVTLGRKVKADVYVCNDDVQHVLYRLNIGLFFIFSMCFSVVVVLAAARRRAPVPIPSTTGRQTHKTTQGNRCGRKERRMKDEEKT
jgi:hypothetical protein